MIQDNFLGLAAVLAVSFALVVSDVVAAEVVVVVVAVAAEVVDAAADVANFFYLGKSQQEFCRDFSFVK